jgi:integrase
MLKHNPDNERIKHKYFSFLKEAKRQSEPTIDGVAKALARFEDYNKYRDFKTFRHEQATGFKKHLIEQKNHRKDTKLSKSTLHTTFAHLKRFFEWLAREQGYKSRIQYSDAEYFNTSSKDMQVATARRTQKSPTLEQIKHVINLMPVKTEIEQRNRALIAFTLLTGARDARDVKTKFSKTFTTFFFPVGDEIRQILIDWIAYIKTEKFWGNDDPLFPMTNISIGANQQFETNGLKREHWSTATPIRKVFKEAFAKADLPYFNPHSFRNTLVQLGQSKCKTPEAFKAWSQNLGHESVLTTLYSYGEVGKQRQADILKDLNSTIQSKQPADSDLADAIVQRLIDRGAKLPA